MKTQLTYLATLLMAIVIVGLGNPTTAAAIEVNSLRDVEAPDLYEGEVTIRSALANPGDSVYIDFDASLNGGTIELSLIGDAHTVLGGEVMGIREEPSGPVSYLVGYFDRDYGKSALYAQKNVVIDASLLPSGITLAWAGGYENPARVLAVYGDLTLTNVTITGGKSVAEELPPPDPNDENGQLSTRARGAGLAVWGVATLRNVTLYDNHCRRESDVPARGRDAGVFGGGIYADIVDIRDSVISGNSLWASGVSGGGVFSVGGADSNVGVSKIVRSAITGNRISGMLGYGGGVYSDGGGIGNAKILELRNSTIARNIVDATVALPLPFVYWRGGGVYMSNGYLEMQSCTVVENEVYGVPREDSLGKPNLAGGIAATIGNAHAVERMTIGHSVIAGNTVHPVAAFSGVPIPDADYEQDIFTGTLLHFNSLGYNRIGTIEFSHMLVPVGQRYWQSLSRKHYPKQGDEDGVILAEVINLDSGITLSDTILSAGVDAPNPVVLHYEPKGNALDQLPPTAYSADQTYAEYTIASGATNNFLEIILGRIESHYGLNWENPAPPGDPGFAAGFTADFETFLTNVDIDDETPGNQPYTDPDGIPILTLADTQWFGPARTWPKEVPNYPYIEFWHHLDTELSNRNIPGMGPELLGDAEWIALFSEGTATLTENRDITMKVWTEDLNNVVLEARDQTGGARPANTYGDIGAYEYFSPPCDNPASEDHCGECVGGDTEKQACIEDCNGVWGGTAYYDNNCPFCVGGNTGQACVQDCNGVWGGEAYIDECSRCVGDGTGNFPCNPGKIIIVKQTIPVGETGSFEFSTDYGSNFFLADGGTNNSGNLLFGTYSVSEVNIPADWKLESATCNDGSNPSAIDLDPGEIVTCTFTNTWIGVGYTLSSGVFGDGTITLNPPGGTYSVGTVVQVTATPAEGFVFDQWSDDLSGSTNNPESITMDDDKAVTAIFVEAPCLPLDARFEEATLSEGIYYYSDRTYTLTSVPPQYIGLDAIITPDDDRDLVASSDYLTFEMPFDSNVYVAYDRRASSRPHWMDGFKNTGDQIYTSLGGQAYLEVYSTEFSAGACVNFGANKAPGFSGDTVGNFMVFYGTPNPLPCSLDARFDETTLSEGMSYYTDKSYTLTNVPPEYEGLYMISTPNNEKNRTDVSDYITFVMPEDGWVYVAFDRRATNLPYWMAGFKIDTDNNIDTSLSSQGYLNIFSKYYKAGDCVNFGANKAPGYSGGGSGNYIVFVDTAVGPPVIIEDVADVTVEEGKEASFSITASGLEPLHYLWTLNGSSVGGDNPSITLHNLQLSDSGGQVVCAVSDALERETWSRGATLTVTPASGLLPKGAACNQDSECNSNKCKGKSGNKTCK